MVSVNTNINNGYSANLTNNPQPQPAVQKTSGIYADALLSGIEKGNKKIQGDTFSKKNFGTAEGNIPLLLAFPLDIYICYKMFSKKTPISKFPKLIGALILGNGILYSASYLLNKHFSKKYDEKYNNLKQKFNEINTDTNAKIAEKSIFNNSLMAGYVPESGKIIISRAMLSGSQKHTEAMLRHELVHARQYETVARSKDGIKKVNFAVANILKNACDPSTKSDFDKIYQDIESNKDKYKNKKIKMDNGAYEANFVDLITAIHTMLNNPNAGMNDIPMIIDANHYQEVINKKGALTPDEEKKADEYYKAMLEYKTSTFFSGLNPWSSYHQNLLEKEAYEENPSFISKMAKRVGKKTE